MNPETTPGSRAVTSLDDCRGLIFKLYVAEGKPLKIVRQFLEEQYNLTFTNRQFDRKIAKWRFRKTVRRSDVSAFRREALGNPDVASMTQRPLNQQKIARYIARNKMMHLQGLPRSFPRAPINLGAPERLFIDISSLIKGSFESKEWRFNGDNKIIHSSPNQTTERKTLHAFLSEIDMGCSAGQNQSAAEHWKNASRNLEILLKGRYHDHLPNIIQKLNDLVRQKRPDIALSLRNHIAQMSREYLRLGYGTAKVFIHFEQLDISSLEEVEERLMNMFRVLFDFYLGKTCYNSFVMMMNAARRKLTRNRWTTFKECLPAIDPLDEKFGLWDHRPLDVLLLRLEILYLRQQYAEVVLNAPGYIDRGLGIRNDPWLRNYHLTKGSYFLGTSQNKLGYFQDARTSLAAAIFWEQQFRESCINDPGSINLFAPERQHLKQQVDYLEILASFETIEMAWDQQQQQDDLIANDF